LITEEVTDEAAGVGIFVLEKLSSTLRPNILFSVVKNSFPSRSYHMVVRADTLDCVGLLCAIVARGVREGG